MEARVRSLNEDIYAAQIDAVVARREQEKMSILQKYSDALTCKEMISSANARSDQGRNSSVLSLETRLLIYLSN
jgi:hypothetical protein